MAPSKRLRVAVIGHAEHVTIARAAALPRAGEILHLGETFAIAGGGGGIAFHQLANGPGEVHFFTAAADDDAGAYVRAALDATQARIHCANRAEPHTRDLVLITPDGERTIIVAGEPLHPRRSDALPWRLLAECDAAYFTGQDPETLAAARTARLLVVTARRVEALARSGVRADVVVGSTGDPREARPLADYAVQPSALVLTEGAAGGRIETAEGIATFPAASAPERIVGSYGAGDSFAGALTWYLAAGWTLRDACIRAAVHGAAVLRGTNPIDSQIALS
jgi:ribokinase